MVRLPRTLSRIALACSLAAPAVPMFLASPALAQQQQQQQQEAQANAELRRAVEDFWHYGKVARYQLAAQAGERALELADSPVAVADAFEAVVAERGDNLDEWMLRWQGLEPMSDITTRLYNTVREGWAQRRGNPEFIAQQIERLPRGERPYRLGLQQLRLSGEPAIQMMVDYLRDPARTEYHSAIRRALRDFGRPALNPLLAATEMSNTDTLVTIVGVLGDMGYDVAVPYLARLAQGQDVPSSVRAAAQQSLSRLGVDPQSVNAAEQFFELAERFYYDNAAIQADTRDPNAMASVWFWDQQRGLQQVQVPPQIFNEIMAMRSAEYAMKLADLPQAQSLWLASNYKREVELPQGASDATRAAEQPPAHFYGVTSGPRYLSDALRRALSDQNPALALQIIRSLQQIAGEANLFEEGGAANVLVQGTESPDRLVRFESAFALAGAMPQQSFQGADRVVPLLAEAMGQTGRPTVLVVAAEQEVLNRLVEGLEQQGYDAAGVTSADAAAGTAASLPGVDVILASEDLGEAEVDRLFAIAAGTQALQGVPRLVITRTGASPFAERAISDRQLYVTQATEPQGLREDLDRVREASALLTLDDQAAGDYAVRAARLLTTLALSGNDVYDLSVAEQRLLAGLNDERPQIVQLAGQVLAQLNSQRAQSAILTAAQNEQAAPETRVDLYDSVATSAKLFGNQLGEGEIGQLRETVANEQDPDVRAAAAEAYGALNLPPDQAKDLILAQSRVTTEPPAANQPQ